MNTIDESIIPNNIKITIIANKFHASNKKSSQNEQRQQEQRQQQQPQQRRDQNYFGGDRPSQEIMSFKSSNKFPKFNSAQEIVLVDPLVKLTDTTIKSSGKYKELQFLIPEKFYELNNKLNKQTSDDIFYYDADNNKIILNGKNIIIPSFGYIDTPIVFEFKEYSAENNGNKYSLIDSLKKTKDNRIKKIEAEQADIVLKQKNNEIAKATTAPSTAADATSTKLKTDKDFATYRLEIVKVDDVFLSSNGKTIKIGAYTFTKETDRAKLIQASIKHEGQTSQVTNNIKLTTENLFEYKSKFFIGSKPYSIYNMTLSPSGWQYNVLNYNLVKDEINLFRVLKPKQPNFKNLYERIKYLLKQHYVGGDGKDATKADAAQKIYISNNDKIKTIYPPENYSICDNKIIGIIDNEVKQFIRTGLNMSEIPSTDILIKYQEYLTKTYEYEKQMDKKNIPYEVRYQFPDDKFFIQSGAWDKGAYDEVKKEQDNDASRMSTSRSSSSVGPGSIGTSSVGSVGTGTSAAVTADAAAIRSVIESTKAEINKYSKVDKPDDIKQLLFPLSFITDYLNKTTDTQITKLTITEITANQEFYKKLQQNFEIILNYTTESARAAAAAAAAATAAANEAAIRAEAARAARAARAIPFPYTPPPPNFINGLNLQQPINSSESYSNIPHISGISNTHGAGVNPYYEVAIACLKNKVILQNTYTTLWPEYLKLIKLLRDNKTKLNNLENFSDTYKLEKTKWEIQEEYYNNMTLLTENNNEENKTFIIDIKNKIKILDIDQNIKDLNIDLSNTTDPIEKVRIQKNIKGNQKKSQDLSKGLQLGGNKIEYNQRGGSNLNDLPPQLYNYFEQYKTLEDFFITTFPYIKSIFTQDLSETKIWPDSISTTNSFFESILNSINNPDNVEKYSELTGGIAPYTIYNLFETLIDEFKKINDGTGNENDKIYFKLYEKFIDDFDKFKHENYSKVDNYVNNKSSNDPIYKALIEKRLPMKLNESFNWDAKNTANNEIFVDNSEKFYEELKKGEYRVDKYSQNPLIKIIGDKLNLYISIIDIDSKIRRINLPNSENKFYMFLYLLNNNYTIFSNNHNAKITTLYKVLPQTYEDIKFNTQIQEGKLPSLLLILYLYVHSDNPSIYPFTLLKNEIEKLDYNQIQIIKKEKTKLKDFKPSASSTSAYSQQNYGQSASINKTQVCYYVTLRLDLYEGDELPLMNCDMKQNNILTKITDLTGYAVPTKIMGIPTGVPGPIEENKWLDLLPETSKNATNKPTIFGQVSNLFNQAKQMINAPTATNATNATKNKAIKRGGATTRKRPAPTTKKITFTKFKISSRKNHNITHKHLN